MQDGRESVHGGPGSVHSDAWSVLCLNCHQPLTGRFCSQCGQRAVPPHPTVRQLVGETWAELVGWDGKAAATLKTLVRRPGELTRALLDGQRTRYISPVRLYLTCSLVYFLLAVGAPAPEVEFDASFSVGVGVGAEAGDEKPGEKEFGLAVARGLAALTPEEQRTALGFVETQPWILRPMLRALAADYPTLKRRATETMPRTFFLLLPALAGILALFYRGRPFPDHLYFALHLQSFVFLVGCAFLIAQYTRSIGVIGTVQGAVALAILFYMVVAQRRVYGGGWLRHAWKALAIGVIYLSVFAAVSLAVMIWVARSS